MTFLLCVNGRRLFGPYRVLTSGLWLASSVWHRHELRLHGDARPHLLEAVDDYPFARLHAFGDLPQAVVERSQADGARHHLVVLAHDVDDLLALVGVEGAVGDEQRPMGKADRHADAG